MFSLLCRRKPHNDKDGNNEGSAETTAAVNATTTSNEEDVCAPSKVSEPETNFGSIQVSLILKHCM